MTYDICKQKTERTYDLVLFHCDLRYKLCKKCFCKALGKESKRRMTDGEKAELNFIEFDHNGLHFECTKGGMVVYKDGEKVGQCFDVFTKFIPSKEDIIKFWEALINEFTSSSENPNK